MTRMAGERTRVGYTSRPSREGYTLTFGRGIVFVALS